MFFRINASEPEYGVTCRHGSLECLGNIHELCTISYYPEVAVWWPFVLCLNSHGRYEVGKESVSRECAERFGVEWDKSGIAECVDGGRGVDLLRKNVVVTHSLGVE